MFNLLKNFLILILFINYLITPLLSKDIVKVGITSLPTSRGNPFKTTTGLPSLYTHAAMFEGLTRVSQQATPVPLLAESWQYENELTWLFFLRKNVTFSNGEPFNSNSVVFSFNLLQSDQGRSWNVTAELDGISSIEALDDYTIRIRTSSPDILLPHKIASLKIVPPNYWKEVGEEGFADLPIGTGPYMVKSWGVSRVILERFKQAWRKSNVENIELVTAPDAVSRIQGFLSGRFHIAVQLGPDEVYMIEDSGHFVSRGFDPSMQVLAFITEKDSPLKDVRVRRALNFAVNREVIVSKLLSNKVHMATQTAPSFAFGWDPNIEPWPYDIKKARGLLKEAGYPNGFSFTAEILLSAASYSSQVYQQVASDLSKVDVNLSITRIPASQYARGVYQGKWKGEAIGIDYGVNPTLDALTPLVRHSCFWSKPWFCDQSIMPLIEKAQSAFNIEERRRLTQDVMRYQLELAPAILLYETSRFDAVNKDLLGYYIEVGHIDYNKLYFKK